MTTVTLFGRRECCLCDEARVLLERLRDDFDFALDQVDIDESDDLHKRFLVRIPVIALDGEELYDYEVDEPDLRARLSERRAGDSTG